MKVHYPKLYNMTHRLTLNVFLLPKGLTIIFIILFTYPLIFIKTSGKVMEYLSLKRLGLYMDIKSTL